MGFKGHSVGPSSGQFFRRQGPGGSKAFDSAITDLQVMSNRFRVIGREAAEDAREVIRENVIQHIQDGSGNFHGYSVGRLAATIGFYDPSQFNEGDGASQAAAEEWADAEGVSAETIESADELTVYDTGAYSSIKRFRGNSWAVEVGTFTPYAGLVEDGGSMEIAMYGSNKRTHMATWEANHMFKKGMFESEVDLEKVMDRKVKAILE